MDRREFLKTLGLGGIALTLPKPLEVIAAKISDLEDPPIHAGLARFRSLEGINVYSFSLSCIDEDFANPSRYLDFMNNWRVHLVAHTGDKDYTPLLTSRADRLIVKKESDRHLHPKFSQNLLPCRLLIQTMLDIWIVPCGKPVDTLPALSIILHGEQVSRPCQGTFRPVEFSTPVRSVRLERGRAIELGLAFPDDPFEIV